MEHASTKQSSSFAWLNITQFLGALNDNVFKILIIFFLIGAKGPESAGSVTALAGAVFVVPFLIFSAFAGKLSDKFSKRSIVVCAKVAEAVIMALGCIAFLYGSSFLLYGILFLMATQSAFFAPAKYGIVPELVETDKLSKANGALESLTYLAIVIGTAAGPFLAQITMGRYFLLGLICVFIALAGFTTSLKIKKTKAFGSQQKASLLFIRDIWQTLKGIKTEKELLMAVVGSAYFLLIGGFIYTNLIPYGISHLGLDEVQSGYLFLVAAIGIGLGSLWAGRLSGRNVEFGIVPIGAIGLTISSAGLGFTAEQLYPTLVLVLIMGISSGLFIVPIHALIQLRSPEKDRGKIMAASAFLGWVGVLIASITIYLLSSVLGMPASRVFMILGIITLVPTIITIIILPDFLGRFIGMLLTRSIYKIKISGIENVPLEKGTLIVSNHVSWVDAMLISSILQRRTRFVMERRFYNNKWIHAICRLMKVIPISMYDPPKKIIKSLRQIRDALDDGDIVCIFAEGAITRNGLLRGFKAGFERIMKGTDYPIIPIYIGGAWGSIFSYYSGKLVSTLPRKLPYPISIHFGKPMASESTPGQVRQKVLELSCDYFNSLNDKKRSLSRRFIKVARKNWRHKCISDISGAKLNYGRTLAGALALGEKIEELTASQENIGILLPPSVAGALTNIATTLLGKIPVNLNYSMGEKIKEHVKKQCDLKTVISSKKFMKKLDLTLNDPDTIFIEDIVKTITGKDKFIALLKALFMPIPILCKNKYRWGDDTATIIFSSGSSGTPKGVMLSHHNLISNIEAIRMVIRITPNDDLCGMLPFFHSFGFNCSLWLPILNGISASYIPNPLDGKAAGKSARQNKSTILFAPPTFLSTYLRRTEPEDFKTLRLVVAGAEKLKPELAKAFEEKFNLHLFEGYGATELSPVASLSIDDTEVGGFSQVGHKDASVGHPIPGIAAKTINIETRQQIEDGSAGLLMIKGPNVMNHYLNMKEKTQEVIQDGWYDTGDIAAIDQDGFITITDRLSRFSKIGGEMVPHIGVEEIYQKHLNTDQQVIAVVSIPDERKGEELAVIYTEQAGDADSLHGIIVGSDAPNIFKPKRNNYFKVDALPMLGSGKLDIVKLRIIALEATRKTME
jgi:acyl-[acyl-carrier-protein]-phospholipid O-acyltransferase / long-chain-fatty-acid--[acyl-carrier-protein] ligase